MAKVVKTWEDLMGMVTDTHYLQIIPKVGCGWIMSFKDNKSVAYLNTHTFSPIRREYFTELLKSYGFDVEISG